MLHLELGFEGLTLGEARAMVQVLCQALREELPPGLERDPLESNAVSFNYRRIMIRNIVVHEECKEALPHKVKRLLAALHQPYAQNLRGAKPLKWFLFFHQDQLIGYGATDQTSACWGPLPLVGQGYGLTLLDKIAVSSFSGYLKALAARNIRLTQSLILEFPAQSKTLAGVPWVEILEQETVVQAEARGERLSYVVTQVRNSLLLRSWLHDTHSPYVYALPFAAAIQEDSLVYGYIQQILDNHHSIKFLVTSTEAAATTKTLTCCISLGPQVALPGTGATWIEVLQRRLHTFAALYARDQQRLRHKLAAGIAYTAADMINTVVTRQLLARRKLAEVTSFQVTLDAQGAVRGGLKLGSRWYAPFTLYRLHEYTALSTSYPELRSYIAWYLYRDQLVAEGRTEQLLCPGSQLFKQLLSATTSCAAGALIVQLVALGTHLTELLQTHKVVLRTTSLKRDPYQIRPFLKRYLAVFSALDLNVAELEGCWEEAVQQGWATPEHLVYLRSLHHWCLQKLARALTQAGGKPQYIAVEHQDNPHILVLTQQALTRQLPVYRALLKLVERISKLTGPLIPLTTLTPVEQELLTTAHQALTQIVTLEAQLELYLQQHLIWHPDPALTSHRRGFMGRLHEVMIHSLGAIHTL